MTEALGDRVGKHRGDGFMARCPVHDDHTESLSVTWSEGSGDRGGLVLLNCHGCQAPAAEIADALDLSMAELFDEPPVRSDRRDRVGRSPQARRSGARRGKLGRLPKSLLPAVKAPESGWEQTCLYSYLTTEGVLVEEVIREEVVDEAGKRWKRFRQRFKDSHGTWRNVKPGDFQAVLYRQPELVAAVAAGRTVWVCEGEKDVETAEGLGLVATTNAQGAGVFPDHLLALFVGADVKVVCDRDQAGYQRGAELTDALMAAGAGRVQVLLPAVTDAKADLTDHVDAGLVDEGDELRGLEPISVAEARALALGAQVEGTCEKLERILGEAQAQAALLDGDDADVDEIRRRVKRWAVEAERAVEKAVDLAGGLPALVAETGTRRAERAMRAAEDALDLARSRAVTAHEVAGMPLPPLLQSSAPALSAVPAPDDEDVPLPEPPAVEPGSMEDLLTSDPGTVHELGSRREAEEARLHGLPVERSDYRLLDGRLVEVVHKPDKPPVVKELLSLDARLVGVEVLEQIEDAVDVTALGLLDPDMLAAQAELSPSPIAEVIGYVIGYTDPATGQFMQIPVKARDYWDCKWVEALPGPPGFDSRPAGVAKLRDALKAAGQAAHGGIPTIVRHRATGWRRREDGSWYFVHAVGAIDGDGYVPVPVALSGPMANYALPKPSSDVEELRSAARDCSLALLDGMPDRIAAPLMGHVFRAALGPNKWVLGLVGSPGSYKTAVASLAMHHWGLGWDRSRPGSSMSGNGDTQNAMRILLNQAKDALYWADDVAPTKSWSQAQKTFGEFARMVHNSEKRSRSSRDGLEVLDGTAPRASAMITSEVMPPPGSAAERILIVPMQKAEIDVEDIKRLDDVTARRGRALLMASFLRWLAGGRLERMQKLAAGEEDSWARTASDAGQSVRQSQAMGSVWSGWVVWAEFLEEAGILTAEEVSAVLGRVMDGLGEAATASVDPDMPGRTGVRVCDLLRHALVTGQAYVEDVRSGQAPPWPMASQLGWRRTLVPSGMGSEQLSRIDPGRMRIGYVLHDPGPRDGEAQLLIDPAGLEAILKAAAATMTDDLQIDRGTAMRALCDEEILIPELRAGTTPRYTVQRSIHCEERRQRVVALRLWRVITAGGGDNPQPGEGPDDIDGGPSGPAVWPTIDELLGGTCPGRAIASAPSPQPGTGIDAMEETVTRLVDGDTRTGPCISCGADGPVALDGGRTVFLHPHCWQSTTPHDRFSWAIRAVDTGLDPEHYQPDPELADPAGDVGESVQLSFEQAPATPEPAAAPALPKPAAVAVAAPEPAAAAGGARKKTSPAPVPAGELVTAVVVDTDGVWFPDGHREDLPTPLTHVGHLAELGIRLGLGTRFSQRRVEPGQVWVTDAALREIFGVHVECDEPDDPQSVREACELATAGTDLVTVAVDEGWQIGGRQKDRLKSFTYVWRGESARIRVALLSAMVRNGGETPMLEEDMSAAQVAYRVHRYATALGQPWAVSDSSTGIDLAINTRWRERDRFFTPYPPCPPAGNANLEHDFAWTRTPSAEERRMRYVHGYDRGASYVAAVAGLELGIGQPVHYPTGTEFDPKVPGYWKLLPGGDSWDDWRYPHPLNPVSDPQSEQWVTTPALQLAVELGFVPEVLEAWVWPEHGRVLDPWYSRLRDGLKAVRTGEVDDEAVRGQLKTTYARTIGMFGSATFMRDRMGFAPDRRHMIIGKSRANILRRVLQIGRDADRWPLAISKDLVVYASDEPDPVAAWPGLERNYGREFGQFKWEGSALMDEHADHFTGGRYRGASALLDEGWPCEGGQ
ncbi:telomere-binding protein [Dietzia cercidiphylli]|uniref:telomere-binding protein n=1 Tax=Dietzia cercidiphylli TaxID=498199 RepID=UPI003F7EA32B